MDSNTPEYSNEQVDGAIDADQTAPRRAVTPTVLEAMKRARNGGSRDEVPARTLHKHPVLTSDRQNSETTGEEASDAASLSENEPSEIELPTLPTAAASQPPTPPGAMFSLSRWKALIGILFLAILVFNALNSGNAQFLGAQGWGIVLGGSNNTNNQNILNTINKELQHHVTPSPGLTATATQQITPAQYINLIIKNMTLDQKLGQMMIVQFLGPAYSLDISAMISQYDVGAVLLFTANNNIQTKTQLKGLISQMQRNSAIPLAVAIDQEGGYVDRLVNLDGARPSASSIGATNDASKAQAEGVQDASDLASYGFNLNLAPVVDVNTVYNPQLYGRTFGNTPAIVTRMAEAYLQGLQQSGKVFGTLKHFPGLGDVATDPHSGVPDVYRSKSQLEAIDWAPYRAMIQQGNVHAIMVTHEVLYAIDGSMPSSLSYKVVTGILRDELGFQGVIITDSLTMEGITAFYSEAQAAALAIEAGDDLIMGASTPRDVASMIEGIKQAVTTGAISTQRIDDSVRRILTMKFQMGLLSIPTN